MTHQEIKQFWKTLQECVERLTPVASAGNDWYALHDLQMLSHVCAQAAHYADATGVAKIAELSDALKRLMPMDGAFSQLYAFSQHAGEMLDTPILQMSEKREMLANRLYAMHRYLDGISGQEDFGTISTERGDDIHYGIGLGLKDGSLLKLLTRLTQNKAPEADSVIERCFEEDAHGLIDAVGSGQGALEDYFHAQLILRYDPILSRKVYALSDSLQARFGRLGAEPVVRSAQISLMAGNRFLNANRQAKRAGIESMRGFAMLFDLNQTPGDDVLDQMKSVSAESGKCLSLADSVISRLHGQHAVHWKSRLESVFQGYGMVDDRIYDEKRFWGQNVENTRWESPDLVFDDENVHSVPTPGHHYIVSPGDRLSVLTEKAYGEHGDYRFVLRQNPHILNPEALKPGTRLYFPEIPAPGTTGGMRDVTLPAAVNIEKTSVIFRHREISPLSPMTLAQLEHFVQTLEMLSDGALYRASVVAAANGFAIVCQEKTLIVAGEDNLAVAAELYPDEQNPLKAWLDHLAVQMRGDVVLDGGICLPFASIPGQMHRNLWAAAALNRALKNEAVPPLRAVIHPRLFAADVLDARDEMVIRLEEQDFTAIENMRDARLNDFTAPFIEKLEALTLVWLHRACRMPYDIAVPPFEHANQYSVAQGDEDVRIWAPIGTPVYPILPGKVIECGRYPVVGYGVLIEHECGICSRYSSLARLHVQAGQTVTPGRVIARSGGSNFEGQPMLRLEIRKCHKLLDWQGFEGPVLNYYDVIHHGWPGMSLIPCVIGD